MQETPLEPVTTQDEETVHFRKMEQQQTAIQRRSSGIRPCILWQQRGVAVHLTSADSSSGAETEPKLLSENAAPPSSMRISFATDGKT